MNFCYKKYVFNIVDFPNNGFILGNLQILNTDQKQFSSTVKKIYHRQLSFISVTFFYKSIWLKYYIFHKIDNYIFSFQSQYSNSQYFPYTDGQNERTMKETSCVDHIFQTF